VHTPSHRLVEWPNGSHALTFSADEPDTLRSGQCHVIWADELAKWRYQEQVWQQVPYILRLPRKPAFTTWVKPIILIGTTPQPTKTIKELKNDKASVIPTTVSSFMNEANLDPIYIRNLRKLEGSRLGRQEIHAEILEDNPNGVDGFSYEIFDATRVKTEAEAKAVLDRLTRIVIAIDPAVTKTKKNDDTGIVVAGKDGEGHGYIIEDKTMKGTPAEWATTAINLYLKYGANVIVAEVNQGGDMVEALLRSINKTVAYESVRAVVGKSIRAEPVGNLYKQRLIHHLGTFSELETQMVDFNTEIAVDQQK